MRMCYNCTLIPLIMHFMAYLSKLHNMFISFINKYDLTLEKCIQK